MLNHYSVQLSQGHQSQPSKNTNLIMTLTVLRNIQQFTKPFSRRLSPHWTLAWMALHHPPEMLQPLPATTTSSSPMEDPYSSHPLNCPAFLLLTFCTLYSLAQCSLLSDNFPNLSPFR